MTIMKSENLSISAEKFLLPVSVADIEQAAARILGHVERTPLVRSDFLSQRHGAPVHLKLETLQPIGAFKLRGAMNAILSLDDEARRRGLVTASTPSSEQETRRAAKSSKTA